MIVTSLTGSTGGSSTGVIDLSLSTEFSPESPAAATSRTELTEVATDSELDFSLLAES